MTLFQTCQHAIENTAKQRKQSVH